MSREAEDCSLGTGSASSSARYADTSALYSAADTSARYPDTSAHFADVAGRYPDSTSAHFADISGRYPDPSAPCRYVDTSALFTEALLPARRPGMPAIFIHVKILDEYVQMDLVLLVFSIL
jgi:hypothetical protein